MKKCGKALLFIDRCIKDDDAGESAAAAAQHKVKATTRLCLLFHPLHLLSTRQKVMELSLVCFLDSNHFFFFLSSFFFFSWITFSGWVVLWLGWWRALSFVTFFPSLSLSLSSSSLIAAWRGLSPSSSLHQANLLLLPPKSHPPSARWTPHDQNSRHCREGAREISNTQRYFIFFLLLLRLL